MRAAMRVPLFQVDAFTSVVFGGNPAAIMLVPHGVAMSDAFLTDIAAENNLSETAFVQPLTADTKDSFEHGKS